MLKYKAIPASNKIRLATFKILTVILTDIWKNGTSNSVTGENKDWNDMKILDTVLRRIPIVRNIRVALVRAQKGYFTRASVNILNDWVNKRVSYISEKHSLQLSNRANLCWTEA